MSNKKNLEKLSNDKLANVTSKIANTIVYHVTDTIRLAKEAEAKALVEK